MVLAHHGLKKLELKSPRNIPGAFQFTKCALCTGRLSLRHTGLLGNRRLIQFAKFQIHELRVLSQLDSPSSGNVCRVSLCLNCIGVTSLWAQANCVVDVLERE